jgi:hypothetical protein
MSQDIKKFLKPRGGFSSNYAAPYGFKVRYTDLKGKRIAKAKAKRIEVYDKHRDEKEPIYVIKTRKNAIPIKRLKKTHEFNEGYEHIRGVYNLWNVYGLPVVSNLPQKVLSNQLLVIPSLIRLHVFIGRIHRTILVSPFKPKLKRTNKPLKSLTKSYLKHCVKWWNDFLRSMINGHYEEFKIRIIGFEFFWNEIKTL